MNPKFYQIIVFSLLMLAVVGCGTSARRKKLDAAYPLCLVKDSGDVICPGLDDED